MTNTDEYSRNNMNYSLSLMYACTTALCIAASAAAQPPEVINIINPTDIINPTEWQEEIWFDQFDFTGLGFKDGVDTFATRRRFRYYDNRIYIGGESETPNTVEDAWVRSLRARDGHPEWVTEIDLYGDADNLVDMAVSHDTVVAVGRSATPNDGSQDGFVYVLNRENGDVKWSDNISFDDGAVESDDKAKAVAVRGGSVYVAGEFNNTAGRGEDWFLRKYNNNGGVWYTRIFDLENDDDDIKDLAVVLDTVIILGAGKRVDGASDLVVRGIRTFNGLQRWMYVDDHEGYEVKPEGLVVNGINAYILGNVIGPNDMGVWALNIMTGRLMWKKLLGVPDADARTLKADSLSLYVIGSTANSSEDAIILALDRSNGNEIWRTQIDYAGNDDDARDIAVSNVSIDNADIGRKLYVTGRVEDMAGNRDAAVWKVDAWSGALEGTAIFDLDGRDDKGEFVQISDSGRVFHAGVGEIDADREDDVFVRAISGNH